MLHHPRLICRRYKHLLLNAGASVSHWQTFLTSPGEATEMFVDIKGLHSSCNSNIPNISSLFVWSHFIFSLGFCPCGWGMQCLLLDFWISSLCQIRDRQTESLVHAKAQRVAGRRGPKPTKDWFLKGKAQRWRQESSRWSQRAARWCDASDDDYWKIVARKRVHYQLKCFLPGTHCSVSPQPQFVNC